MNYSMIVHPHWITCESLGVFPMPQMSIMSKNLTHVPVVISSLATL